MRRAAKVDQNQEQIVNALRGIGASVQSLAAIGNGCPDLLVAKGGQMYLMEVKRGKAAPNELQKRWHIEWRSAVHVVRSVDEALGVIWRDA